MNTQPINPLTHAGLEALTEHLTEIAVALDDLNTMPQRDQAPVLERCERILPTDLFEELRAHLGSIRAHQATVCELLWGEPCLLALDGYVPDSFAAVTPNVGETECSPTDLCDPHGIPRPHAQCDEGDPFEQHNEAIATVLDALGRVADDALD